MNLFVVILCIFVFLLITFILFINNKSYNRSIKDSSELLISPAKINELNPDINTKNWDLHKFRLMKFGRSQYKGVTFFVSSEDKIYYLCEKGTKVYC